MAKTEASVLLPAAGGFLSSGGTSLLGATALLATFSTTSSNVMYPWTYGRLGVVLGPLAGIVLQTLMFLKLKIRTFTVSGHGGLTHTGLHCAHQPMKTELCRCWVGGWRNPHGWTQHVTLFCVPLFAATHFP